MNIQKIIRKINWGTKNKENQIDRWIIDSKPKEYNERIVMEKIRSTLCTCSFYLCPLVPYLLCFVYSTSIVRADWMMSHVFCELTGWWVMYTLSWLGTICAVLRTLLFLNVSTCGIFIWLVIIIGSFWYFVCFHR